MALAFFVVHQHIVSVHFSPKVTHTAKILQSPTNKIYCNILLELNRYAEVLYKRLTEDFYPARQLSFLA